MRAAFTRQFHRVVGHQVAVDDRRERQGARRRRRDVIEDVRRGVDQRLDRDRAARCVTPSLSNTSSATVRARAMSYTEVAGELCAMARWNSPAAAGTVSRVVAIPAPADSPNSVTCGIAAERGDIVRTHSSASSTSRRPTLVSNCWSGVESAEFQEAQRAHPVVERDHDDVLGGQRRRRRKAAGCRIRRCMRRRAPTP